MALTDSETDDPAVLLEQLKLKFPSTNVILTLGSEGAIYQSQSETYTQSVQDTRG